MGKKKKKHFPDWIIVSSIERRKRERTEQKRILFQIYIIGLHELNFTGKDFKLLRSGSTVSHKRHVD